MTIKSIFLDRDGVINKDINYLHKIEDFNFIDGVFEACNHFKNLDYKIIIITNQSGIARGFYNQDAFQKLTDWMIAEFVKNEINILDIFFCPHSPTEDCNCRKPKPGMLLEAKRKYNIDMQKSWFIGDQEADIMAANNAGITNTILVRSGHKINESTSNAKYFLNSVLQSIQTIKN
jgi:D-glycero-D-manno-heptose 1,7-bisphosphate phosphatase